MKVPQNMPLIAFWMVASAAAGGFVVSAQHSASGAPAAYPSIHDTTYVKCKAMVANGHLLRLGDIDGFARVLKKIPFSAGDEAIVGPARDDLVQYLEAIVGNGVGQLADKIQAFDDAVEGL